MPKAWALVLCLTIAGALAVLACRTPAPRPATADGFSAAAAMADVRAIAARAHPVASADHDRVRAYLLGRFRALGLQPQVRVGQAFEEAEVGRERFIEGGRVENILAVLPGRSRTAPALMLTAHYDTVPASPGAADDTAGVAAALEIARLLKAGPPPARDVVFLITDGEEAGLLGARAFFASDPLARHIGVDLNMEARGSGGRVYMFETSAHNAGLMRMFAAAERRASANSLSGYVYALMANDTDFSIARMHAVQGLNFAFMGRLFDYHAASATPATLDQGSLQHMGEEVLAIARSLAAAPRLPALGPDLVYGDLLGGPVIAYPAWTGWLVLAGTAGVLALAFGRAFRREPFAWRSALAGAAAAALTLVLAGVLLSGLRGLTGVPHGFVQQLPLLARFGVYEAALAAGCLAAAALAFAAAGRGRPQLWSAWAGACALVLLLAAGLQATAPVTAQIPAWPLLAAAVTALVLSFGDLERTGWRIVAAVLAALPLAQLIALAHPLAVGVGADLPQPLAALSLIACAPLFPLLWPEGRGMAVLGALALAASLLLVLAIRLTTPWSARHPAPTEAAYVQDLGSGRFWRASALPPADAWTRAVLAADGGRTRRLDLRPWRGEGWAAPALPAALPLPRAGIARGANGAPVLQVIPSSPALETILDVRFQGDSAAAVNGQPVVLAGSGAWTRLRWTSPDGLTLAFASPVTGLEARYAVVGEGWPAAARPLPPLPPDAMPWRQSGSSVVLGMLH